MANEGEYDLVTLKNVKDFAMTENECYTTIEQSEKKQSRPDILLTTDTSRISKVERSLIVLVGILFAILIAVAALAVAVYIQSNTLARQLSSLQDLSDVQNASYIRLLDEVSRLDKNVGNSQKEVGALKREVNVSLVSLGTKIETLTQDIANISTTSSNATVNVFYDVLALLAHTIQSIHVFESCATITSTTSLPFTSGLYRIRSYDGTPVQLYCPLSCNVTTGEWRRVASLNTYNSDSVQCPSGLVARADPPSCTRNSSAAGCSSVTYRVEGGAYSCIIGRIVARQSGYPDAFLNTMNNGPRPHQSTSIEGNYVDGVSLSYGRNPRNHIWTFAAALRFTNQISDCDNCNIYIPMFVGSDYSCETNQQGATGSTVCNDPLWDGDQCVGNATFYRQLPQPTTDDIEMRVCRDQDSSDEDILITFIELYVQ